MYKNIQTVEYFATKDKILWVLFPEKILLRSETKNREPWIRKIWSAFLQTAETKLL